MTMSSIEFLKKTVEMLDQKPEIKKEILSFKKVFQIEISDGNPYYVDLTSDSVKIIEGKHPSPNATIIAQDQVLEDVFSGKLDGVKAFMTGKLKIKGDAFSVQKLSSTINKARK
jgi:Putative sterol carrier protein